MALNEKKIAALKEMARRGEPGEKDNALRILKANGIEFDPDKVEPAKKSFKDMAEELRHRQQTAKAYRAADDGSNRHTHSERVAFDFEDLFGSKFTEEIERLKRAEAARRQKEKDDIQDYIRKQQGKVVVKEFAIPYNFDGKYLLLQIITRKYFPSIPEPVIIKPADDTQIQSIPRIKVKCTQAELHKILDLVREHKDRFRREYQSFAKHVCTWIFK